METTTPPAAARRAHELDAARGDLGSASPDVPSSPRFAISLASAPSAAAHAATFAACPPAVTCVAAGVSSPEATAPFETDDDVEQEVADGADEHSYNRLMDDDARRERLRDLLIGGVVGAFAALAAVRRRRPPERTVTTGLAAFEDAPCYREAVEREAASRSFATVSRSAPRRTVRRFVSASAIDSALPASCARRASFRYERTSPVGSTVRTTRNGPNVRVSKASRGSAGGWALRAAGWGCRCRSRRRPRAPRPSGSARCSARSARRGSARGTTERETGLRRLARPPGTAGRSRTGHRRSATSPPASPLPRRALPHAPRARRDRAHGRPRPAPGELEPHEGGDDDDERRRLHAAQRAAAPTSPSRRRRGRTAGRR